MGQEHINLLLEKYRKLFSDIRFRHSVIFGVVLLLLSGLATSLAKTYANQAVGNPVGDLILDHLPTLPLFGFLVWGTLFIAFSIFAFALFKPGYLPITLKSTALLYFTRAIFISLTHLQVHPGKVVATTEHEHLANLLYYGNDLFFSGHVALPFLAMLIFWKYRWFRVYLILAVIASALAVLLAKSHYSIDVLAAPFITFSIFEISKYIFKKDAELIKTE